LSSLEGGIQYKVFSSTSIRQNIEAGYATAQQALRSRAQWPCMHPVGTAPGVIGVSPP
jgi:hypothetical protein